MVCLRKMWYFSCWLKIRWKMERLVWNVLHKMWIETRKAISICSIMDIMISWYFPASPRRRRLAALCPARRGAARGRRSSPRGPPPRTPPSRSRPLSRVTCHNLALKVVAPELLHRTCSKYRHLALRKRNSNITVKNITMRKVEPEWMYSGTVWIHSRTEWIHSEPEWNHSG